MKQDINSEFEEWWNNFITNKYISIDIPRKEIARKAYESGKAFGMDEIARALIPNNQRIRRKFKKKTEKKL